MSDHPKKRGLFRLHLSTCIVLMFVAGGLLWANVHRRETLDHFIWMVKDGSSATVQVPKVFRHSYGWPLTFFERRGWIGWTAVGEERIDQAIVIDLLVAAVIMLLVGFGCEAIVRRGKRRT